MRYTADQINATRDSLVADDGLHWVNATDEDVARHLDVRARARAAHADSVPARVTRLDEQVPGVRRKPVDQNDAAYKTDEQVYAEHEARMRRVYADAQKAGSLDGIGGGGQ